MLVVNVLGQPVNATIALPDSAGTAAHPAEILCHHGVASPAAKVILIQVFEQVHFVEVRIDQPLLTKRL